MAAALLVAHGANQRLEAMQASVREGQLLYLPNGRLLNLVSLGHREPLADLIYLWSIQYYGHYGGEVRYDYVEQVFDAVITELDPRFRDAYDLGSLILAWEAGRPEDALKLLDKGIANNPDDWFLPFEAGFTAYHLLKQYDRAAAYFQRSMSTPGAPAVVRRLHAAMFEKMGDPRTSLQLWRDILSDASSEYVRRVAARHVKDLTREVHLQDLREAVRIFRSRTGMPPPDLRALVRAGILVAVPLDPDGRSYVYDPQTGEVSAPPAERR